MTVFNPGFPKIESFSEEFNQIVGAVFFTGELYKFAEYTFSEKAKQGGHAEEETIEEISKMVAKMIMSKIIFSPIEDVKIMTNKVCMLIQKIVDSNEIAYSEEARLIRSALKKVPRLTQEINENNWRKHQLREKS